MGAWGAISGRLAAGLMAALGLALALVAAPQAGALEKGPDAGLPLLHATRGSDHPGVYDSERRQVLLRGVNVNALGDYFQSNPAFPTVAPLHRSDFRRIRRLGFNSVRLIVSWSKLEPQRGAFNIRYVEKIKGAIRWARHLGLYVVVDMHQDAWGKYIATPEGASCPPGTNPSIGWDGAPKWATITDGASTCNFGARELSPAVAAAWKSFNADRDGIQTELVKTWRRLARKLAANKTVAGFDLLNEPGITDAAGLGRFYGRAIDAIRAGESSRPRGVHHIVFFEPSVLWSALGTYPTPPPDFTDDRNIVFAPHIYAESIAPVSIAEGFAFAAETAAGYGTTVWSGEWGYFASNPADDEDKITRYGEAEDDAAYGGAWWDYKQSCGDPHMIGTRGGLPAPVSVSLIRFDCDVPGGVGNEIGVPDDFRTVLSRPVPRAVPGRIVSLESDGAARTMSLEGRAKRSACGLEVYVPRGERPRVTGRGISRVRISRGGRAWRVSACVAGGRYSMRVG